MILHHSLVGEATARAWMLVLHGIFGSGGNLRTLARGIHAARPDWGFVLTDLRCHGRSLAATPPHTLDSAAADLVTLRGQLAEQGRVVRGVIGHSFGGKVALRLRELSDLEQTWVLDASPSARPTALDDVDRDVPRVLVALESLPAGFGSRQQFIEAVISIGLSQGVAQWLAMNLEQDDGQMRFRLDLADIRALLLDYYQTDLWASLAGGTGAVEVVVAGKSAAYDVDDRQRLQTLASESAHLSCHVFEQAGHWVHADSNAALVALVASRLPPT